MVKPTCCSVYRTIKLVLNISGNNYFSINDVIKVFLLYNKSYNINNLVSKKIKLLEKFGYIKKNKNNNTYHNIYQKNDESSLDTIDKIYDNTFILKNQSLNLFKKVMNDLFYPKCDKYILPQKVKCIDDECIEFECTEKEFDFIKKDFKPKLLVPTNLSSNNCYASVDSFNSYFPPNTSKYIEKKSIKKDSKSKCITSTFTNKYILVKSETDSNTTYKVTLSKCSCTCPHWKYNGPIICKHILSAAKTTGISISELENNLAVYTKNIKPSYKKPGTHIIQVKSMTYPHNKVYDVDIINKTCSCPSFLYSTKSGFMCKHLKKVASK